MKEKILIFIHAIIAILAFTSFLWLDIKWIIIGVALYWLEMLIFDSCVLSIIQFKNKETTFIGTYINKLLRIIKIKELTFKQQKILLRYIEPIVVILLAILLQVVCNWQPFI